MKTSWAYPASRQTKRVKGKRKGKTHRVVAALMSNHLNQVHAWSTKTKEWNKAHSHLCLQKEKGSIPNWFALYAVTRENGEPRTDTRCLTKTRSKNRQTTVRQFVSYTIYSRSGGGFFFFQSNTEIVTENTPAAATMPFSAYKKVNKKLITAILTYIWFKILLYFT